MEHTYIYIYGEFIFYHAVHFHTAKNKKWKATSEIRDAAGRFEGRQREIEVLRKRRRGFPPRGELLKKKERLPGLGYETPGVYTVARKHELTVNLKIYQR